MAEVEGGAARSWQVVPGADRPRRDTRSIRRRSSRGGATMSVHEELKRIADDYATRRISRRTLGKRAAALGLSAPWIAALAKGADAAPAPLWSARGALGASAQTD